MPDKIDQFISAFTELIESHGDKVVKVYATWDLDSLIASTILFHILEKMTRPCVIEVVTDQHNLSQNYLNIFIGIQNNSAILGVLDDINSGDINVSTPSLITGLTDEFPNSRVMIKQLKNTQQLPQNIIELWLIASSLNGKGIINDRGNSNCAYLSDGDKDSVSYLTNATNIYWQSVLKIRELLHQPHPLYFADLSFNQKEVDKFIYESSIASEKSLIQLPVEEMKRVVTKLLTARPTLDNNTLIHELEIIEIRVFKHNGIVSRDFALLLSDLFYERNLESVFRFMMRPISYTKQIQALAKKHLQIFQTMVQQVEDGVTCTQLTHGSYVEFQKKINPNYFGSLLAYCLERKVFPSSRYQAIVFRGEEAILKVSSDELTIEEINDSIFVDKDVQVLHLSTKFCIFQYSSPISVLEAVDRFLDINY